MATLSAHVSRLARGLAAIIVACLILLQFSSVSPARAGARAGETAALPLCGADRAGGLPVEPAAHRLCAICVGAAALDAPAPALCPTATIPPARRLAPPVSRRDRRASSPPGWASSWSSQAPPARL